MHPKTAGEWLRCWDRGEPVFTLECGGIGPGYEQAIQILVIELIRDHPDNLPPTSEDWGDDTVRGIDADCGGFSGAQVGMAKWLARRLLVEGPAAFFERVKKEGQGDRMIQVSRHWPRAPEAAR